MCDPTAAETRRLMLWSILHVLGMLETLGLHPHSSEASTAGTHSTDEGTVDREDF